MTIGKLSPYGKSVSRPQQLAVLQSDREIAADFLKTKFPTSNTVTNGSIARALGIAPHNPSIDARTLVTHVLIDLLHVEFRTEDKWYRTNSDNKVTSIVVAGSIVLQHLTPFSTHLVISNSGIVHGRDVLPRAHPNDGFVDVLHIDYAMTNRQRISAWRRAKTGSHLPHPHLRASRDTEFEWSGRSSRMVADNVTFVGVEWLRCTVLADATSLYF